MKDYRRQSKHILQRLGDLQIWEVTTQALDSFVQDVAVNRGVPTTRKNRTILLGMFKIAVRYNAIPVNPIRELTSIAGKRKKRARSLDPESLAALLRDLRTSDVPCPVILAPYQLARGQKTSSTDIPTVAKFCASNDMADIITMFAATSCRIGELLAIRWQDINLDTKTVAVTGQIVRIRGEGLVRQDRTKSEAGDDRDLPLPAFAITMLRGRRQDSVYVFESLAGTILDPETVGRRWRQIRAAVDLEWVTSHTFRKNLATILDEEGLTARQAADQLGHAQVSMTQDVYFGRGKVHTAAADALDTAVSGK
ncbi:tyrosine recombinase XerC [Rhodococcus sp. NPDC060176]|uniref:site-specific integrase n=1 Tax=unclassified Rhodococcus (in: high G+C Gram-positive bacteria) TaxID=192944 RepID=UPI00366836A0